MMNSKIVAVAVAFSACVQTGRGASALAQSLADVARQEEGRRKTIREPAKVYTNKDLGPGSGTAETAFEAQSDVAKEPPAPGAPAPGEPAKAAGDAVKAPSDKEKQPVKDRAYWAGRMKGLQDQLEKDQIYADALQSRISALTADFTSRDDPAQRSVISQDRQKALVELDRLKEAIQKDKNAVADLEEEARRAAVSPGWLR